MLNYSIHRSISISIFFFFNDTATTEIYTLSLHDALPISEGGKSMASHKIGTQEEWATARAELLVREEEHARLGDRKSTRLNSSHGYISYAVFCLKKKK